MESENIPENAPVAIRALGKSGGGGICRPRLPVSLGLQTDAALRG